MLTEASVRITRMSAVISTGGLTLDDVNPARHKKGAGSTGP